MPQVTVYIRNEDLPKWKAIEKKTEFLHNALNGATLSFQKMEKIVEPLKDLPESPAQAFVPKPPDPETGYPCCQGKRPCKHWQWSTEREAYINLLTGKEREPDII